MSRVLLVDDEPALLFALSELLTQKGHRVVTAGCGGEALARLEGVDVVITDLAMPGMSGLELLGRLRARDVQVPVILITAHGSASALAEALQCGAYGCLSKPFDNEELAATVERALAARADGT